MSYSKENNTINMDGKSDFLVDSGVFFVHMIRELSLSENGKKSTRKDWCTLKNWLGCKENQLTPIEDEKVGVAWKAYLSIGSAPSFKLQNAFTKYSEQYKSSGYCFKKDKPPEEIFGVFDRLLATDEEISDKRAYEYAELGKKLDKVIKKLPKKKLTLNQKLNSLSKSSRVFISASIAWCVFVVIRTTNDSRFLGFYFDSWDADMFLENLFLPVIFSLFFIKAYKWVVGARK